MYYQANRVIRKCSSFINVAVLLIPICFVVIFIEAMFFEIREFSWYILFLWLFLILLTVIFSFLLLLMIRIYQIIDKWDQLFTIKNAVSFINMGLDGEKYLQFNLKQQDIWRLREKNELKRANKTS